MKFQSTEMPAGSVTEELVPNLPFALWRHPYFGERFPWLVQGTTDASADFGLFGNQPSGDVLARWRSLNTIGATTTIHSRQVHTTAIMEWSESLPAGLCLVDGFDGHLTARSGILLTVSVADCVPVFLISPGPLRVIGLVHAGWRGVAGGILERAIDALTRSSGCSPAVIHMHCGPAICGRCYEVGPEVHEAVFPGASAPRNAGLIDLRRALAMRAVGLGVDPSNVSVSSHCTRCGPGRFFSHRGGDAGRQLAVLGILA